MKKISTIMAMLLSILSTPIVAESTVKESEQGLSKTTVFDTPTPTGFSYRDNFPGSGETLPRAYSGAPPQIPHNVSGFKPITAKLNMCLGCHNNPSMMGKREKGKPTSMPSSHYTDLRNKPDVQGEIVIGARYVCTQCHVPQANVKLLVDNDFEKKK